MELYLHNKESEESQLIVVAEEVRLEEVVAEHAEVGAGAWLEDVEEELDISLTIRELAIVERSHVHINTCRRILVTVRQDTEKTKDFVPSATIAKVYEWASGPDGFDLLPAERVKHTFVICGTQTEPDKSAHVGSFADASCGVCFNLVPKHRSEGKPVTDRLVMTPSERLLRQHLAGGRFQTGVDRGEWRIIEERDWPNLIIAVSAAPRPGAPDEFALFFDTTDYPSRAPTAMPWDPETGEKLAEGKRPKGERAGMAFRVNWEGGRALYVPYDRVALESHGDWKTRFPRLAWEPTKTITFYLRNVHDLLNDDDYQGV